MKVLILCALVVLLLSSICWAQAQTVFVGNPEMRIAHSNTPGTPEDLSGDEVAEYECVITETDGHYYWTTRESVELKRVRSGMYTTYFAITGGGYIRIIDPGLKGAVYSILGETEREFDYVETLFTGLGTISYYGILE